MRPILDLVGKGGAVMFAILGLSVVLYSGCFRLLFSLRRSRRLLELLGPVTAVEVPRLRHEVLGVSLFYQRQRAALGAMVTAAPLIGLLGTVIGMVKTFESLSEHSVEKTMEGLARGISQVLVSTESGLIVAIPALLLIYFAHLERGRYLRSANAIEQRALEST